MNNKKDGKATASLVLGIIGLFVAGIILGIVALVLSNQSIKANGPSRAATAGKILGIIDIVAFFVVIILRNILL
jgi:hypothetical protein